MSSARSTAPAVATRRRDEIGASPSRRRVACPDVTNPGRLLLAASIAAVLAAVLAACGDVDGEDISNVVDEATADYRITVDYSGYDQTDWAGMWRSIEDRAREECIPGDIEDITVVFENVAPGALDTDRRRWHLDCDDL
jgi:hypothetical protein